MSGGNSELIQVGEQHKADWTWEEEEFFKREHLQRAWGLA